MKIDRIAVDNNRLQEIENQFKSMGISTTQQPEYSDPEVFGRMFKQCTILQDVPIVTTDSSAYSL